jgi:hypothetical protein
MKTVTITLKGLVVQDKDDQGFSFKEGSDPYMSAWDIPVGPTEISHDFEIPADYNPITEQIKIIDTKLDKAAEAYFGLKKELEQAKQDLLCLEAPLDVPHPIKEIVDDFPF